MSKSVQVNQNSLFALAGLLAVSLVAVGYLIGRQNATELPTPQNVSPSPPSVRLLEPAQQSLDSRVSALQDRVGTLQTKTAPQDISVKGKSAEEQPPSEETKANEAYFQVLDSVLGRSAFSSGQPFSTRLAEQAVSSGKTEDFEKVLAQTAQAIARVEALNEPPSCAEHKSLALGQLRNSLAFLKELQLALESNDDNKIQALSEIDPKMMKEAIRLKELDDSLRPPTSRS